MTTDKILDKLAKLKACREGEAAIGNQAAAEAFAGMINTLLLKHELSETDIPLRAEVDDPIIELMVDPRVHGFKFSNARIGWQEAMARIVAQAHLCKFLVTTGTNYITFVGTKSHVAVAEYAYVVLVNAADKMSMKAREEYWKNECGGKHLASGNYRAAWLSGFIGRISERFAEIKKSEVREAVASGVASSTSTALVRLDSQLVRAQQYISDKYKRKASIVHMQTGNYAGRLAGRQAADKMELGRKGVTGSATASGFKQVRG